MITTKASIDPQIKYCSYMATHNKTRILHKYYIYKYHGIMMKKPLRNNKLYLCIASILLLSACATNSEQELERERLLKKRLN